MKFFYSLLPGLAIWLYPLLLIGQIQNGDFEEWNQTFKWEHPVGWTDPYGNDPCTIKESNAISGEYSLRIKGGQTNRIGCTVLSVFEVDAIYNFLQLAIRIDSIREDSFTSMIISVFEKNDDRFIKIGSHRMFHPTNGIELIQIPIEHSGADSIMIEIFGKLAVSPTDFVMGFIDAVLDDFQLLFLTSTDSISRTNEHYKIYPQPARDILHIISDDSSNPQKVDILSIDGKVMSSFRNTSSLNIEGFAIGIYILRIISSDGTVQVQMLIKS